MRGSKSKKPVNTTFYRLLVCFGLILARKEGQVSNPFKEDLFQIIDFPDENQSETTLILKQTD